MSTDIIDYLNGMDEAFDAAQLTEYQVYIGGQPITVVVYDYGPDKGGSRFAAEAFLTELGRDRSREKDAYSLGNPEATAHAAVALGPHWWRIRAAALADD